VSGTNRTVMSSHTIADVFFDILTEGLHLFSF
jgi:hypothetical protein